MTRTVRSGLAHSATPEEMDDIETFLSDKLPALDKDSAKSEL